MAVADELTDASMDSVGSDEVLYRNVTCGRNRCSIQPDGTLKFSSQAFLDRAFQPSVDRANLCNSDPIHTRRHKDDGVTSLLAGEVKALKDVGLPNKHGELDLIYEVDV